MSRTLRYPIMTARSLDTAARLLWVALERAKREHIKAWGGFEFEPPMAELLASLEAQAAKVRDLAAANELHARGRG